MFETLILKMKLKEKWEI